MASLNYTPKFWEDMAKIADFLVNVANTQQSLDVYDTIIHGIQTLIKHPKIGRRLAPYDLRELVISYGNTGYIALYSYHELTDIVTLHAIKHQRESGYH